MACFNRKSKTLACLENLFRQTVVKQGAIKLKVFLLDDASTDGTVKAVEAQYPEVDILTGNGSLFWNGGMHVAFDRALKQNFDFYLWLNDDTVLYEDALEKLFTSYEALGKKGAPGSILVGSTIDPCTQCFSYGGFLRAGKFSALKLQSILPGEQLKECTTMCGNCVFIPRVVAQRVGNLDPQFKHRWGDTDYGLRARKQKCQVWIAPEYVGTCEANPGAEEWTSGHLSFRERVKIFHSVKGYRKRDWFIYVKRHGGPLWSLLWVKPYLDMLILSMKSKFLKKSYS